MESISTIHELLLALKRIDRALMYSSEITNNTHTTKEIFGRSVMGFLSLLRLRIVSRDVQHDFVDSLHGFR